MPKKKKAISVDQQSSLPKRITVSGRNQEQKNALKALHENDITFIYGPPGTGKTFLSVGYALNQFLRGAYDRIIFTRPCVEAYGENLGFLPGDFNDKISPYMIPIFDVLELFLDRKIVNSLIDERRIITLPLAFQRGITFHNSVVVADEFQNTIPQQVRMILTRLGENSKIAVTGDPGQADRIGQNGLVDAIERFRGTQGIGIVHLSHKSIVRHPLVRKIDEKYDKKSKS